MPLSPTRYAYRYNTLGRLMPEAFDDHSERSAWLSEAPTRRWPISRRDLTREQIREALYFKNLLIGEEKCPT